jgi:hypothetical protein
MNKNYKTKLSVLTIIGFFVIAIASKPSQMTFGNSEKWIPNDFDPRQTTLLVEDFFISKKAEKKWKIIWQKNIHTNMNSSHPKR